MPTFAAGVVGIVQSRVSENHRWAYDLTGEEAGTGGNGISHLAAQSSLGKAILALKTAMRTTLRSYEDSGSIKQTNSIVNIDRLDENRF